MDIKYKKILSLIVILVLVALVLYYGNKNISEFKELEIVNPWLILWLLPLIFIGLYFGGLNNALPLRASGVYLKNWEIFQLAVITRFYNLITPFRGGMAIRALYLKRKYNFAVTDFFVALSANYVIIFLVSSLIGIITTYMIYLERGVFSWVLFLVFLAFFVGMIIIMFSPKLKDRNGRWLGKLFRIINGWHLVKKDPKMVFGLVLTSTIQILLGSLMLWLQFRAFGIEIGFAVALFLNAIASLSILIGITPGNLGVQEAVVVFSAVTIGITPVESLSTSLLGRAVSLAVLFVLGPLFSWKLIKK